MRKTIAFFSAALLVGLGCVIIPSEHTINAHIVVDVNIIAKQVGDINSYIAGETDEFPDLTAPEEKPQTWLQRTRDAFMPMQRVYAQERSADEVTAEIKQAADKRRERKPKIDELKAKKAVGENNRGYIDLRPSEYLENAEKKAEAQKLLTDENADRKAMYKGLAQIHKKPMATMEQISAYDLLKNAKPGELFQLPQKGELFDEFKASEKGQRLGEACAPGAWVEIK